MADKHHTLPSPQQDTALVEAAVSRGLQLLGHTSHSPSPASLQPFPWGAYFQPDSSKGADLSAEGYSQQESAYKQEFESLSMKQASVPHRTASIFAGSMIGGVLDGGPFGSRHPQVWHAALVHGLAHSQPDINKKLRREARERWVSCSGNGSSTTSPFHAAFLCLNGSMNSCIKRQGSGE